MSHIVRLLFAATINKIWLERNDRVYDNDHSGSTARFLAAES